MKNPIISWKIQKKMKTIKKLICCKSQKNTSSQTKQTHSTATNIKSPEAPIPIPSPRPFPNQEPSPYSQKNIEAQHNKHKELRKEMLRNNIPRGSIDLYYIQKNQSECNIKSTGSFQSKITTKVANSQKSISTKTQAIKSNFTKKLETTGNVIRDVRRQSMQIKDLSKFH